jgi:nucleotide-binding universal stress UspA family protein
MFSNVLIGVDGRQGGRDAIALARQLAAPDARITMAHVYSSDWLLGSRSGTGVPFERDEAERLLEAERRTSRLAAELISAAYTAPGRGLHELAERLEADLLVVGSTRHALLGRVLLGDDTHAALNGAPCAIAIAPRGYTQTEHPLETLGLGYEGSPGSELALAAARELANRYGAKIKALWAVSLQNVRDERPIPGDWRQTADALVERCLDQLSRIEGIDGEAVYGGPREELSRLSDGVDLLIVGSRGYGPVGRLFHGSVSSYLVGHVSCPLLVLPRSVAMVESPATEEASAIGMGTTT